MFFREEKKNFFQKIILVFIFGFLILEVKKLISKEIKKKNIIFEKS